MHLSVLFLEREAYRKHSQDVYFQLGQLSSLLAQFFVQRLLIIFFNMITEWLFLLTLYFSRHFRLYFLPTTNKINYNPKFALLLQDLYYRPQGRVCCIGFGDDK